MRLVPEQRKLIKQLVKEVGNKSSVARALNVTRRTAYKWLKRKRYNDRKRKTKKEKITVEIEYSILSLRRMFGWGSRRIKQVIKCAPGYLLKEMSFLVQGVSLSRSAINGVLKKHGLNGYKRKPKESNFLHAKKANEIWQLDPKGAYTIQGKKYWFVICIDDYSRFMIMAKWYDHAPSCADIQKDLLSHIKKHKPEKILTDNNPFKKSWDAWCSEQGVESVHAHPYYPQDKGKVERAIRTISEEFIYLIKKFPHWLKKTIEEYRSWYNEQRFHYGIENTPAKLFACKI